MTKTFFAAAAYAFFLFNFFQYPTRADSWLQQSGIQIGDFILVQGVFVVVLLAGAVRAAFKK